MIKQIIKKILIGLGIVFIVLIVVGGIFIALVNLMREARVSLSSGSMPEALFLEETEKAGEVSSETPSRLVIKTGTLNMVVKDIDGSVKGIVQYTESKGGWVVLSSVTEREKIPSGSVTVRVPAEIFDETMSHFRGLAEKVTYEGTQGQDITEEYTDLQSQLRNLEATETQLLKIMERSGTIPDVLAAQRELTNVREKIERIKGRIQYLERSTEMATITINLALSEELLPVPPAEKWRPVYIIKRAWNSVLGSLRSISYLLIWIGIYAIIWVPLVTIIWQVRKLWKKRKEKKTI